jgi:hypothetical protein
MNRFLLSCAVLALLTACGPTGSEDNDEPEIDVNANADGDCLTDIEEEELGTDPEKEDSDGDGVSDCDEIDAVSDPTDEDELPYACGWPHNDPGNIQPTGAAVGDVIYEVELPDQCGDNVNLWDFHGQYRIIYMTAAW